MSSRPSRPSFSPPRAGALRGVWNTWYAFRRRTWRQLPTLPKVVRPITVGWSDVWVVLLPTYGWLALGRVAFFRLAAGLYAVGAVAAVLFLGLPAAGWAAGVMISLHAMGVAEYFYSGKIWPRPRHWLARYVAVLVGMAVVYAYCGPRLYRLVVVPVQSERGLVLINPRIRPATAARGEEVAFRRDRWQKYNYMLPAGVFFGQVLGLPGEVIHFGSGEFTVNGRSQPRLVGMPQSGAVTVPAGHCFIWSKAMRREFPNREQAEDFARTAALVIEADIVGRPYHRWFLRNQDAPSTGAGPAPGRGGKK